MEQLQLKYMYIIIVNFDKLQILSCHFPSVDLFSFFLSIPLHATQYVHKSNIPLNCLFELLINNIFRLDINKHLYFVNRVCLHFNDK